MVMRREFVGKNIGGQKIGEVDGCMDGSRSVDVITVGVNLECGVGTNGCWDRTKC